VENSEAVEFGLNEASVGQSEASDPSPVQVRSLKELLDRITGRGITTQQLAEESGLAEVLPFPFLALVGQHEMKLALLLSLINPLVGGVLLIGPRGTGKTTAVRSLADLLPEVPRSLCYYGCLPEDIESGGMDAVCPDCARKFAEGEPLVKMDRVRIIELPLNSGLEDVIGGVDERAASQDRYRRHKGLLAQADRNLLYVDEVNLLQDEIVDALLDAAAQGKYTIRRGPVAATFHSRLVIIGSMNPEEGDLRPQIMDRFGLRVIVRGLETPEERLEAYRRVQAYFNHPRQTVQQFAVETRIAQAEIQAARELLPEVTLPDDVARNGLRLIGNLQIDSLRAEITLFETARAYAAADHRLAVTQEDLCLVAPMALRLRRSKFIKDFFALRGDEEKELAAVLEGIFQRSNEG